MEKRYKILRIFTVILLILTGSSALIAGFLFILEPSGKLMGMSSSYLATSPFKTFLIPGIILFMVNGVLNILVAVLTIKKDKNYPALVITQGILLSGWILVQVVMVHDFNMLHFIMFTIGVLLLVFGLILYKNSKA